MRGHQKSKYANDLSANQTAQGDIKQNKDYILEFKLERYKYILQEIHSLNENIHKYLTLFQALVTAIIGGGITIFLSRKMLRIYASLGHTGNMRLSVCAICLH